MWMIRAGRGGFLFDEFKANSMAAIGWNKTGDLSNVTSSEDIRALLSKVYDYSKPKLHNAAGQISRFRNDIKIDDYVITYNSSERMYLVGKFVSDYKYDTTFSQYFHFRKVKWISEISRDILSTTTRNSLGSTLTVFCPSPEAEAEILDVLQGKPKEEKAVEPEKAEDSLEVIKEDFEERAHEFIKDKVSNLDWEEMQELVAGLLRAMGYKTHVSPKGPDRGRDIIASPDGLGLEEPRIVTEVKHRNGAMGADKIRSFLGGLRPGDKGLYVSTGGFAKEAKYEADRSNIPINLLDSDMLINLITQYYDNFDSEARSLIQLKKVYWPA